MVVHKVSFTGLENQIREQIAKGYSWFRIFNNFSRGGIGFIEIWAQLWALLEKARWK